jgi:LPS-assembly protein
VAGDPVWVRDMTADVLGRSLPYRRSDLLASHRRSDVVAEAVGSFAQPLRPDGLVAGEPAGTLGAGLGGASRWGLGSATLLPFAAGPLQLSGRAGAARFGPGSGARDVVGRPAATRADARAELGAPVLVGGAVTVAPFVRGAALGYAFDDGGDPAASAWGIAGAVVQTELSRRRGAVRHAIAPRLEWRAGTGAAGEVLAVPAYDAFDRSSAPGFLLSAAPGPFQQLRGAVETRLERGGADLARLELGQDVDLRAGRLAETFAALGVAAGPVSGSARASFFTDGRGLPAPSPRIPSDLDRFTELRADLSVRNRRGDGFRAGFLAVGPGGSGALVVGIDPLFDVRPAPLEAAAAATAGVHATVGSARLAYEALLPGRAAFVPRCEGDGERRVGALQVQQHTGSVAWESSCRCFRVLALARVSDCGERSYSVSFDLAGVANALTR